MSITLSISIFFVIAALYIVIIDIFTMLFVVTGMAEEKARFQVISLLTNSGYTTKESEIVVEMVARRKMARTIMLFGYIFAITVVSIFVNILVSLSNYERHEVWPSLLVVAAVFVAFVLIKRIPVVRTFFNDKLEQVGRKWVYRKRDNAIILLDEYNHGVIAKVILQKVPQAFEGKTLEEIGLPDSHNIHVFFINRENEEITHVTGETVFAPGDILFVFGQRKMIEQTFANAEIK